MNNTKMDTNDSVVARPPSVDVLRPVDLVCEVCRVYSVCLVVWLNNANQMNQTDQIGEATVLRNYAMEQ
jgi:hypothetical protein